MADPVIITNLAIPGTIVAAALGWGVREWVKNVREDVKSSKAERETIASTMASMSQSITRLTDALTGFNGNGGLMARVEEIKNQADRALDRANVVSNHVHRLANEIMDIQSRGEHRDFFLKEIGEQVGVPYHAIPARRNAEPERQEDV